MIHLVPIESSCLRLFFFLLSENDRPTSLVPDLIDYNMPLTATYLKQMKLQCMTAPERVSTSPCQWCNCL